MKLFKPQEERAITGADLRAAQARWNTRVDFARRGDLKGHAHARHGGRS